MIRLSIVGVAIMLASLVHGQKPNIILIVSDDQGYRDLGCYGSESIKTPNLDQLASEGVRFTDFYVTCSACTPSRSGLLTGRYPQRNGTYELFRNDRVDDGHLYPDYEYSVSPEHILGMDEREVLISDFLRQQGYVNGIFGKWDLGQLHRFLPLQRGFDRFYGFANTGIDYFSHERYGIPSMYDDNTPTQADKGTYTTDLFEREALAFVKQNKDQPFFLYLPFNAPHSASNLDPTIRGSVQAPESFILQYPEGRTKREKRERGYRAAVTCMDQAIGNILALVRDLGLEERTFVIFLSDNGGSGAADNHPLRGRKAQMFEGGVRVPCIMKYPGKINAGQVNHALVSSLDILPTVLTAAGATASESIVFDGHDLWNMLVGMGSGTNRRTTMFWEFRGEQAARVEQWKWIQTKEGNMLFDLSTDIGEKNNLSKVKPAVLSRVQRHFSDWRDEMAKAEPRGPFRDF